MSTTPKPDYDALAEWAQSDKPTVQPGTKMARGTASDHAALRAMLEAGPETPEEKAMLARATAPPDAEPHVSTVVDTRDSLGAYKKNGPQLQLRPVRNDLVRRGHEVERSVSPGPVRSIRSENSVCIECWPLACHELSIYLETFNTCPIPEIARLWRTLRRWRDQLLGYCTTDRANDGSSASRTADVATPRRCAQG